MKKAKRALLIMLALLVAFIGGRCAANKDKNKSEKPTPLTAIMDTAYDLFGDKEPEEEKLTPNEILTEKMINDETPFKDHQECLALFKQLEKQAIEESDTYYLEESQKKIERYYKMTVDFLLSKEGLRGVSYQDLEVKEQLEFLKTSLQIDYIYQHGYPVAKAEFKEVEKNLSKIMKDWIHAE